MRRKYADLSPTQDEIDQGASIGDKLKTTELGNTLFNLGESGLGKAVKGGVKGIGAIGSVTQPLMEGASKSKKSREVGKAMGKSGNLDEDAKERLEETFDQMRGLVKEAEGMGDWKKPVAIGALSAVGATGAKAGIKGLGNLMRSRKAENVWGELQEEHPDLANEDTREHFEVVKQFAPDLATNPSTARSFLKRMKRTGMAPHEFVDRLTQTQGNIERGRMSGDIADEASSALSKNLPGASDVQGAEQKERHFQEKKKQSSGLQQELDELDPR